MFIEAKDDGSGGDNWSYKSCEAPVKPSPPTNQHPIFLQAGCFLSPNQQCQSTEGNPQSSDLNIDHKQSLMATSVNLRCILSAKCCKERSLINLCIFDIFAF